MWVERIGMHMRGIRLSFSVRNINDPVAVVGLYYTVGWWDVHFNGDAEKYR